MTDKSTLRMVLPLSQLPAFFPLLQRGIWMQAQVGCGVMSLLTKQFGIAEDYIVERITTLFLDGRPVDDLETSYVKDGSTLALSAAMPGLVGATMRRGGHLAAMRGSISCPSQKLERGGTGRVRIKLFNMVMTELGAIFLAQGVCLSNADFSEFLSEQEDGFWQSFGVAILGDQQIEPVQLKKQFSQADTAGELLVTVEFKD